MKQYPAGFLALVALFKDSEYFRGEETMQEDFKRFLQEEIIEKKDSE